MIYCYARPCPQIDYGRKVRDAALEKYGADVLKSDEMSIFVRMVMSRVTGLIEVLDFVVKVSELGLPLNKDILSKDIMAKIVDAGSRKGKSAMPLLWVLRNRLVSSQKGSPNKCTPRNHFTFQPVFKDHTLATLHTYRLYSMPQVIKSPFSN